MKSDIDVGIL